MSPKIYDLISKRLVSRGRAGNMVVSAVQRRIMRSRRTLEIKDGLFVLLLKRIIIPHYAAGLWSILIIFHGHMCKMRKCGLGFLDVQDVRICVHVIQLVWIMLVQLLKLHSRFVKIAQTIVRQRELSARSCIN